MIPTQDAIKQLASRIEQGYRRRYPRWQPVGMTIQPWETSAARLIAAVGLKASIPVDPELLVAAQPRVNGPHDPWAELASEQAIRRYFRAVRRIVGQLREELRQEVRVAERRMLRGISLDQLLDGGNARISPLTGYLLALRAGRDDLADRLRPAAESQHRACPLYRLAARYLISVPCYPIPGDPGFAQASPNNTLRFSLN